MSRKALSLFLTVVVFITATNHVTSIYGRQISSTSTAQPSAQTAAHGAPAIDDKDHDRLADNLPLSSADLKPSQDESSIEAHHSTRHSKHGLSLDGGYNTAASTDDKARGGDKTSSQNQVALTASVSKQHRKKRNVQNVEANLENRQRNINEEDEFDGEDTEDDDELGNDDAAVKRKWAGGKNMAVWGKKRSGHDEVSLDGADAAKRKWGGSNMAVWGKKRKWSTGNNMAVWGKRDAMADEGDMDEAWEKRGWKGGKNMALWGKKRDDTHVLDDDMLSTHLEKRKKPPQWGR